MQTIYKYLLNTGSTVVPVPKGGVVLSAQEQFGDVCVWVVVDTDREFEDRHFEVFGTGHFMSEGERDFIGTVQLMGGSLIFHVFEKALPVYKT